MKSVKKTLTTKKSFKAAIAIVSVALFLAIAGGVLHYYTTVRRDANFAPVVFSTNRMQLELWSNYKTQFIEASSGRTVDRSNKNITTSEGESYTMLRAVWMDDQPTFDKSLAWTMQNLSRPDGAFMWKYGEVSPGTYGVLVNEGGNNTASDADVDIALSLIMAGERWHDSSYTKQAQTVIDGIWSQDIVTIKGQPILASNNQEKDNQSSILVNPSYFAPYAYKVFAGYDSKHNWEGVADSSYSLLAKAAALPTGPLTPDWIRVSRSDVSVSLAPGLSSDYGYEALRTPWRLALDYNWFKDPRDVSLLKTYAPLKDSYDQRGSLAAIYKTNGQVAQDYKNAALTSAFQGYMEVIAPTQADHYYKTQLTVYYDPDRQAYVEGTNYYDANWIAFGIGLHLNTLPNLTKVKHL